MPSNNECMNFGADEHVVEVVEYESITQWMCRLRFKMVDTPVRIVGGCRCGQHVLVLPLRARINEQPAWRDRNELPRFA